MIDKKLIESALQLTELEIWKPIGGYEGLYEVSNLGRIKSLVDNHGLKRDKILIGSISDGYLRLSLCKNKKHKNKTTMTFIGYGKWRCDSCGTEYSGYTTRCIDGCKKENMTDGKSNLISN